MGNGFSSLAFGLPADEAAKFPRADGRSVDLGREFGTCHPRHCQRNW